MENDLVKQQHEEMKIEKFKIFAERNAQSTKDYAQIFSQLVTRYDSINSQDFSGQKAVRKFLETRKISNETSLDAPYIHFGICTEVIKNEGGRWMAFPKIQKGKVIAIMIAYADKEDIRVGYREMGHTTDFYRDFVDVFQKAFDEEVSKNKGKNKANRGETLIDEVVITYFNSNRQDWNQLRSLIFDLGRFEHYRQYNFWDGCNYSNGLDEQCIAYGMCENNKDVYYHYEDPPKKTKEEKCREAKNEISKLTKALSNSKVKEAIGKVNDLMKLQSDNNLLKENAFAVGIDSKGNYHISRITTASDNNRYSVSYNQFPQDSGIKQIMVYHNHIGENSHSPGDFYELINTALQIDSYTTNLVKNNLGELYALTIYDRESALNFLKKYPKNTNSKSYNFSGDLLSDYEILCASSDWTVNGNVNAYQVGLVNFLDKYDTGVSLSKFTSESNFVTYQAESKEVYYSKLNETHTVYETKNCP